MGGAMIYFSTFHMKDDNDVRMTSSILDMWHQSSATSTWTRSKGDSNKTSSCPQQIHYDEFGLDYIQSCLSLFQTNLTFTSDMLTRTRNKDSWLDLQCVNGRTSQSILECQMLSLMWRTVIKPLQAAQPLMLWGNEGKYLPVVPVVTVVLSILDPLGWWCCHDSWLCPLLSSPQYVQPVLILISFFSAGYSE